MHLVLMYIPSYIPNSSALLYGTGWHHLVFLLLFSFRSYRMKNQVKWALLLHLPPLSCLIPCSLWSLNVQRVYYQASSWTQQNETYHLSLQVLFSGQVSHWQLEERVYAICITGNHLNYHLKEIVRTIICFLAQNYMRQYYCQICITV